MNVPVAAEPVFSIGSFAVTNALVNSSLVALIFVVFAAAVGSRLRMVPRGAQNAVEAVIEFLLGYFDRVTGDKLKSRRFLPIVGTLFLFILASNWFGLLPGTGSVGVWHLVDGEIELVPLLRSAGSDLNLTLAMALVSVVGSHLIGMMTVGFFVHWNRFIQLGNIWTAVKSLNIQQILVSLIEFLVGLIELVSEAAKVLSLSLRLFGNVFAGEVVLTVMSSLISFALPLPFMFLELIVGVVQATVFSMLTLVYLSILTSMPHGAHEEKHVGHAKAVA